MVADAAQHLDDDRADGGRVVGRARHERERERGDAVDERLARARDGARVVDVVADVGPVVDARQRELGAAVLHDVGERDEDAVDGRAVDGVAAPAEVVEARRAVQRDGLRDAALLVFGRDGRDVAEHLARRVDEHVESEGADAIVVGEQHAHRPGVLAGPARARKRHLEMAARSARLLAQGQPAVVRVGERDAAAPVGADARVDGRDRRACAGLLLARSEDPLGEWLEVRDVCRAADRRQRSHRGGWTASSLAVR